MQNLALLTSFGQKLLGQKLLAAKKDQNIQIVFLLRKIHLRSNLVAHSDFLKVDFLGLNPSLWPMSIYVMLKNSPFRPEMAIWGRSKIDLVLEIHLVREIHDWENRQKYIIWDWNKLITSIFDRKCWIIFWVGINRTKWISSTRSIFHDLEMAISGHKREFLTFIHGPRPQNEAFPPLKWIFIFYHERPDFLRLAQLSFYI